MEEKTKMRLNLYISRAGVCSRRKADELIKNGYVRVNGKKVIQPYIDVSEEDTVTVNRKSISPEKYVYIALNKPTGYICTLKDKFATKKITDLIPKSFGRVYPVGRLDKNSSGLIILTNDGNFTQQLSHPSFNVEKEYEVTVIPKFKKEDIDILKKGIMDADEKLSVVSLEIIKSYPTKSIILMILKEGKKREIRRMLSHLRYHILKLKRIRIGNIHLDDLPLEKYRSLSKQEINEVLQKK